MSKERIFPCASLSLVVALCVVAGVVAGERDVQGLPSVRATQKTDPPAWAVKQRRLLDLNSRAVRLFEKAYVLPNGRINVDFERGGGVHAPDDLMECTHKWPLLYALGADRKAWEVWWKVWQGNIEQCTEEGIFTNGMPRHLDWHHNGEYYQPFWLAGLCAPDDPEYRRQALKYAAFFDGMRPRGNPNYDRKHRVIRSMLTGGAGPVLDPSVEAWAEGGGKNWEPWLECVHDGPVNLATTCFGTTAFMLTGEERWRKRTMEYIDAWHARTMQNDGIIPSIVRPDGTVPEEWWGGVMGWAFGQTEYGGAYSFGGVFQVSSGPRAAWANALLLTGDESYYDPMRILVDTLWKHRFNGRNGKLDLPSERTPEGWVGTQRHHRGGQRIGVYASMLGNLYMASMSEKDRRRALERREAQGMIGHARPFYEGGNEPDWVRFLEGQNPEWPERVLDAAIRRINIQIDALESEARIGPEKKRTVATARPWYAGQYGPLVNLMTGGVVPLWHGQLHIARFRYFDPERWRPGIPRHCAALVEGMGDDRASLVLINTSAEKQHTVLVQTGAYAEHRCVSVTPEGKDPVPVDGTVFAAQLAPRSIARLTVKMERYANTPTLTFPWNRQEPN